MGGQGFRYTDTRSSQTDKRIIVCAFVMCVGQCSHSSRLYVIPQFCCFSQLLRVELMTFGVLVVHIFMVDDFYS